jgi:hypothetical protein
MATPQQAEGAAKAIAQARQSKQTLDALKAVPAADWNNDANRAARNGLYRSGQLSKDYKPGTIGYQNHVDLVAGRLNGPEGDAVRAGLQHDLETAPRAGSRAKPLDPRVYNEIMDKAGLPENKIDPRTFYIGPDDQRTPLIAGRNARNVDWPAGETGKLEKATSDGAGVVVRKPDNTTETIPLDKLNIPGVLPHDRSNQALGFIAGQGPFSHRVDNVINAVQQAHPNAFKQVRINPDLTQPIAKNPWFETLSPEVNTALHKTINVGTFTNPNHVALGDILARDQDHLLGWKELRAAGIDHVAPNDPAFQDLFRKGIVDATGALDEGGLNKQLVRLGLVDKTGVVSDLGKALGATTVDGLKDNLVHADDGLINRLIAQAAGVDYGVGEGWRDAASRAMGDSRTAVGKAMDGYLNFRRSVALTNIASGPRYGLMQAIGNAVTQAIAKPTALLDYVAPIEGTKMWRAAKDLRVESEVEKTLRDAGLPQSPLLRELGPMGKNPIAKATWLGPARAPIQAVFANDVYRRFGNVFDQLMRNSLFKNKWDEEYPRILGALPDRIGDSFAALNRQLPIGASPFPSDWEAEVRQIATSLNPAGKTGRVFSPDDLRRELMTVFDDHLAANPNLATGSRDVFKNFADHMGEEWNSALKAVKADAETEVRRVAFDFDPTKADQLVSRVFMFHFWQSRAGGLYAVEALKNPKYVATFVRTMSALETQSKAEGAPPFLQWFYKYGQTPDGLATWVNLPSLIQVWSTGVVLNSMSGDDPTAKKDMTGYGHFINGPWGSMAFMNPIIKGALQALGAEGPDAKPADIVGDAQAMQRAEDFLNEANQVLPIHRDAQGNPELIQLMDSRSAINVAMQWLQDQGQDHGVPFPLGLSGGDENHNVNRGDQITFNSLIIDQVNKAQPGLTGAALKQALADASQPDSPEYQAALQTYNHANLAGPGFGISGPVGDIAGGVVHLGLGDSFTTSTVASADARNVGAAQAKAAAGGTAPAGGSSAGGSADDVTARMGTFRAPDSDYQSALDAYFHPNGGSTPKSADSIATNYMFSGGAKDRPQIDAALAAKLAAGTPDQRWLQTRFNAIKAGKVAQLTAPDGTVYSNDQIMAMDDNQRSLLANAWLAKQPDGQLQLDAIKDAQQKIVAKNPDLQGMDALYTLIQNADDPDGVVAQMRHDNPAFDTYMSGAEQWAGPVGSDKYRNAASSADAYRALVGVNGDKNTTVPVIPGAAPGQSLQDLYAQQQADKASALQEKIQPINDHLKEMGDVKAAMNADDPSGQLWGGYLSYLQQQAALPQDQRDKRVPSAYYGYTKDAYTWTGSDGQHAAPGFDVFDYLGWYATRQAGQSNDVTSFYRAMAPTRAIYAAQKDQAEASFDPVRDLFGGTPVSPDSVPPSQAHGGDAAPAGGGQLTTQVDLNVRAGPGVDQPVVDIGPAGTNVVPIGTQTVGGQTWVQVQLPNGKTGWMSQAYLAPAA